MISARARAPRWCALVLLLGTLPTLSGCLQSSYWADLAGGAVSTVFDAVLTRVLETVLAGPA